MQALSQADPGAVVEGLISDTLPGQRGVTAWRAFLQAHASLMRDLATDLAAKTGMTLNDFDVLAQLALAGGELRMTDLAARAFSSRSGMTRRIDRLAGEGMVRRGSADADGRGVLIGLTDAGLQRLSEAVPVHLRRVSELFIDRLDDEELAVLDRTLNRVKVDCSFG